MADEAPSAHSTRWLETSRGILRYSELAPLLAERVLRSQERIEAGDYTAAPLDENLILTLHRDFCGDLVPDWAGQWRTIAVQVGQHEPPAPHLVPLQMREYGLDLQARLAEPIEFESLPDTLAFAEARLLTIHPFADFNGRLVRLWLWEILRRLKLPPVQLVPRDKQETENYLSALRAGDKKDFQPLAQLWMRRLATPPPSSITQ
jgi:CRISPR-associated endonuclease/helicase Cas3